MVSTLRQWPGALRVTAKTDWFWSCSDPYPCVELPANITFFFA